jgi:hypothetical protein
MRISAFRTKCFGGARRLRVAFTSIAQLSKKRPEDTCALQKLRETDDTVQRARFIISRNWWCGW